MIHLCYPFRVKISAGSPAYEQVIGSVHRAVAAGKLRPGDTFPSVRALSKELRISPNTALRAVKELTGEGILEVVPGIGTRIAAAKRHSAATRRDLLRPEVEALVLHARRVGSDPAELAEAIANLWDELGPEDQTGKPG